MLKHHNPFDAGYRNQSDIISEMVVYFDNPNSIITLHPFTITSVASTPTIASVGGRPAVTFAVGGSGSEGNNFMIGTAGIIPQPGQRIEFAWNCYSDGWPDHEMVVGFAPVGTAITAAVNGGTEPTNSLLVYKDNAETRWNTKARKASGTESSEQFAQMPELVNSVWYRGHAACTLDANTSGKGTFELSWGLDSEKALTYQKTHYIASAFPDTVAMAFVIGWLTGSAVATNVSWGMVGYRIYRA